jgi:hypothetical protein
MGISAGVRLFSNCAFFPIRVIAPPEALPSSRLYLAEIIIAAELSALEADLQPVERLVVAVRDA